MHLTWWPDPEDEAADDEGEYLGAGVVLEIAEVVQHKVHSEPLVLPPDHSIYDEENANHCQDKKIIFWNRGVH